MKTIIMMVLFTSICTSTTLTINTDIPNSYGSFTLVQARQDTITFSNGITIHNDYFSNWTGSFTMYSEVYVWGIYFDSSSDLIKVGTSNIEYVSPYQGGFLYCGANSSDSNWLRSDTVPSTLVHLYYGCKSYNYQYHDEFPQKIIRRGGIFPNYKTIIYAQSKKNYIKLQISDIFLSPTDSTGSSDSIKISWMVDSLGNGKFLTPVSVNRNTNISSRNFPKKDIYTTRMIGFNIDSRNENIVEHKMYSINGKAIKSPFNRIPKQISIIKE